VGGVYQLGSVRRADDIGLSPYQGGNVLDAILANVEGNGFILLGKYCDKLKSNVPGSNYGYHGVLGPTAMGWENHLTH
jgi:hypothetical protein